MTAIVFEPIHDPGLVGYRAVVDSWTIELVRAETQSWNVYVWFEDDVMSIAQFTRAQRSLSRLYYEGANVSYHRGRRIARLIAEGLSE